MSDRAAKSPTWQRGLRPLAATTKSGILRLATIGRNTLSLMLKDSSSCTPSEPFACNFEGLAKAPRMPAKASTDLL